MTTGWIWNTERLRNILTALGFDVDTSDARHDSGSMIARRDRGERSQVVVVDSGGRFRATLTVVLDEAARTEDVAGVTVRVVTETRRSVTVTALLSDADQLVSLVSTVDTFAPPRAPGDDQPASVPTPA